MMTVGRDSINRGSRRYSRNKAGRICQAQGHACKFQKLALSAIVGTSRVIEPQRNSLRPIRQPMEVQFDYEAI